MATDHAQLCPPNKVPTFHPKTEDLLVVIETPQGSRNKYKYDEQLCTFSLSSVLPQGASFPFDFGFVPGTLGADGDPIDVLVLMDEPAPMGCVVPVRLIGIIEADQTERDETTVRNDRLLAVATEAAAYEGMKSLKELSKPLLHEIEQFFVNYNRMRGKKFKLRGCHGPESADRMLRKGMKAHAKRKK
jgi:inorganic pyrophosphatase